MLLLHSFSDSVYFQHGIPVLFIQFRDHLVIVYMHGSGIHENIPVNTAETPEIPIFKMLPSDQLITSTASMFSPGLAGR
jgi:hypothetical protein